MDSNTESKIYPDISGSRQNPPAYDAPPSGFQQPQYAPAPTGQSIAMMPAGTTVISSTTMMPAIVISQAVGSKPSAVTCRSCNAQVVTRVEYTSSVKTHIIAGLLCVFGCWCCVCIPYCVDNCKNAQHYCPNCSAFIGAYSA